MSLLNKFMEEVYLNNMKEYLPSIVTFITAFSGAWFAFYLQSKKQTTELENAKKLAVNKALFTFYRQYNQLLMVQKQVIEPVRKDPIIFLNMTAMLPIKTDDLAIDVNGLAFLLETKHRQILFEFLIEEEKYQAALQAFNERSILHHEEIQPRLEKAGIKEMSETTDTDISAILGYKLYTQIQRATSQAIEHVDETIKSMKIIGDKFNEILKDLYPKHHFIKFKTNLPNNQ